MYELSAVLVGHSADVRCCCMDSQGHIITGSRDKTAIIWEKISEGSEDTPAAARWRIMCKLNGHTSFVNSIAVLRETEEFPNGLIVTAGQDKLINVYCPGVSEPINQLLGHTEAVTCLSTGWHGTVLSGSADSTVRVWVDFKMQEELKGHTAPVWDVSIYPGEGTFLSASGDKTIRLWKNGKQETVFNGHLDAVRKIVVLLDNTFMSCGNDGTVRHWEVGGTCLNVLTLGSSFLYSMCLLAHGGFAVSGENGNLFVVKEGVYGNGVIAQGIQIPALSVWCCEPLPGLDILVGGSDGVARIFSNSPAKAAPLADRQLMAEQVASQKHSKQAIGDLELEKLQGVEALQRTGREGQTLMINNSGAVEVYQCSGGAWQKIGVVQDAYDKEKHELDGQKFDFVIDVDVADGQAPLKLGCNKDDDPWVVAQTFINKHMLPQAYLTEISEYIMKNTGIGVKEVPLNSEYSDPFTGAGRYVPAGEQGPAATLGTARFYPAKQLQQENIPDAAKLIKKIIEFNALVTPAHRLTDSELHHFEKIAKKTSEGTALVADDMVLVTKLLAWPADHIFPCIDLVRSINKAFPHFIPLSDKIRIAHSNARKPCVPCARVSLRFMVDITAQHPQDCLDRYLDVVSPLMDNLNTTDKKFVCQSLSKILFNMTVLNSDVSTARHILDSISNLLEYMSREITEEKDRSLPEFHGLVATGNLITQHADLTPFVHRPIIVKLTNAQLDKTRISANDILANLS